MPDKKKIIILLVVISFFQATAISQSSFIKSFEENYTESTRQKDSLKSIAGNSVNFMSLSLRIDALLAMYIISNKEYYIGEGKIIINNIIGAARVSSSIPENIFKFKDDYMGWISKTPDYSYNSESQLYESYVFQYISRFLYQLLQTGWTSLSAANTQWYNNTIFFIEKHIWEKWITRSMKSTGMPYRTFLGIRTHMAAHWAGIALVLEQLTQNNEIKKQCRELYTQYDTLLKRNLRPNPAHPDAYIWNSTWDNTDNTQARKDTGAIIQDVSHGNHIVSYIVTAQETGSSNWSRENINKFINTVKLVVYDSQNHIFSDGVDGTSSLTRPGWGNFQADGWLKLGRYDKELQNLYVNFAAIQEKLLKKYSQTLQYYANLALNEYLLSTK